MRGSFLLVGLVLAASSVVTADQPDKKSDKKKKSATSADHRGLPDLDKPLPNGIRFGNKITQRYKVGVVITAPGGPCAGVYATIPVPTDWPEQQVKIVAEEISPSVKE